MPQNPILVYAFLLIFVYDSVSMTEDIKMYLVIIMECPLQMLMWEKVGMRGKNLNKKGNEQQ